GYDQFMNLVLDNAVELVSRTEKKEIGMTVIRGNSVLMWECLDRFNRPSCLIRRHQRRTRRAKRRQKRRLMTKQLLNSNAEGIFLVLSRLGGGTCFDSLPQGYSSSLENYGHHFEPFGILGFPFFESLDWWISSPGGCMVLIVRYKVFVGNMPYNADQDALKHFFKCVKDELLSIRLLTDKKSNESRGCAFVEFSGAGAMKKALAMTGSELNGRKLRIEPSAAGGGKSRKRTQRINRNKKLVEREIKKKRKVWAAKKKTEKESQDGQKTSPT
ncbi:hypothetical protein FOZ62_003307, partial [Perkinsus olseni]